jgi:hypothetical protein
MLGFLRNCMFILKKIEWCRCSSGIINVWKVCCDSHRSHEATASWRPVKLPPSAGTWKELAYGFNLALMPKHRILKHCSTICPPPLVPMVLVRIGSVQRWLWWNFLLKSFKNPRLTGLAWSHLGGLGTAELGVRLSHWLQIC